MKLLIAVLLVAGYSAEWMRSHPSATSIHIQAQGYLARIIPGVHRRLEVRIEPQSAMIRPDVIAEATVEGEVCILHFTPNSLVWHRDMAVAHEAVHCALDYDFLRGMGGEADEARAERMGEELNR